jgi:hypothetical protein
MLSSSTSAVTVAAVPFMMENDLAAWSTLQFDFQDSPTTFPNPISPLPSSTSTNSIAKEFGLTGEEEDEDQDGNTPTAVNQPHSKVKR